MKKTKSIKTYVDNDRLCSLIKSNIDNSYLLDVLYYHVRRALIKLDFNLQDYDGFNISGKYLGYDLGVDFDYNYDNVIKSLSLALSLRAIILNKDYCELIYNDKLLFYDISSNFISWDCHRIIMECMGDEDFSCTYDMIVNYKDSRDISDEQISLFRKYTINPGYQHFESFCKILAARPDYHGRTVIKNNAYLCSDIEEYTVPKHVEYIGNTAFAYCENLKNINIEGKVVFGRFPIIECENLKRITVPTELLLYYKETLPFYRNIIRDYEYSELHEVKEEPGLNINNESFLINESEIEHVYVDVPSADPYHEFEVEHGDKDSEHGDSLLSKSDIDKIQHVFDSKATSYKYFWLLSILQIYKDKKNETINLKDILVKMVSVAWNYVFLKKSHFPAIDQLPNYLKTVQVKVCLDRYSKEHTIEEMVLEYYDTLKLKPVLSPLLKNVPYRFLSPWISFTSNEDVVAKSNDKNARCLYSLQDDHITINPIWSDYLLENYAKLIAFIETELRSFLKCE